MTPTVLFTIGHSNHELPVFIALLRRHGVTEVADVRSSPYSAYNRQYNRESLAEYLRSSAGIEYLYLGRELGARREEPECFDERGQVQFDSVARTPLFQAGLDRLREEAQRHRLALMCAEKDPLTCHRTLLVCRQLQLPEGETTREGEAPAEPQRATDAHPPARLRGSVALPKMDIQHIRESGELESHTAAESRLLKLCKLPERDLFRTRSELLDEAYDQQARRIAWVERQPAESSP
jgi:hypothetical protein